MLWIKALHVVFMVTWFSGLFYLPRLFVYHAMCEDEVSKQRFKIMERKLFFGITTPGAVLTLLFGLWLLSYNFSGYLQATWMQVKLACVGFLLVYHIICGKYMLDFKHDRNKHGHVFYRWFNEVPVVFLFAVVILVIVRP